MKGFWLFLNNTIFCIGDAHRSQTCIGEQRRLRPERHSTRLCIVLRLLRLYYRPRRDTVDIFLVYERQVLDALCYRKTELTSILKLERYLLRKSILTLARQADGSGLWHF